MVKKLRRTGNSLALVLDKSLLAAANIDASTPLEISTDGDVIIISPVRGKRRVAKLRALVKEMDGDHAGAFRHLAD